MSGIRNNRQRRRNKRVKADAAHLLRKLQSEISDRAYEFDQLYDEISEMIGRLEPPTGAAAKIILTGYTKETTS